MVRRLYDFCEASSSIWTFKRLFVCLQRHKAKLSTWNELRKRTLKLFVGAGTFKRVWRRRARQQRASVNKAEREKSFFFSFISFKAQCTSCSSSSQSTNFTRGILWSIPLSLPFFCIMTNYRERWESIPTSRVDSKAKRQRASPRAPARGGWTSHEYQGNTFRESLLLGYRFLALSPSSIDLTVG